MHSYLKAVGFSEIKKRAEMKEIILDVIRNYDEKNVVSDHPDGTFAEFSKSYGYDCGITVCGQYDEDNRFHVEYYYPFFKGTGITTNEPVTVERHADKESFAGACDDLRIGITLIFYLQNAARYRQEQILNQLKGIPVTTTFTGLSSGGRILFPVAKKASAENMDFEKKSVARRSQLMSAAKNGDQDAIESLTIEDMDLYSMVSRRVYKEDVFSIVDTFFMPYARELYHRQRVLIGQHFYC